MRGAWADGCLMAQFVMAKNITSSTRTNTPTTTFSPEAGWRRNTRRGRRDMPVGEKNALSIYFVKF